ncbi:MAG: hypothetical protein ABL897_10620, partial [Hyphomicrobium sp.]
FSYMKASLGVLGSAMVVCMIVFTLGLLALWRLRESFGVDLDFVEVGDGTVRLAEFTAAESAGHLPRKS